MDQPPAYTAPSFTVNTIQATLNFVVQVDGPVATISADGDVTIDWAAAEKAITNADKHDPTTLAITRLMIAIRDGTYKTR